MNESERLGCTYKLKKSAKLHQTKARQQAVCYDFTPALTSLKIALMQKKESLFPQVLFLISPVGSLRQIQLKFGDGSELKTSVCLYRNGIIDSDYVEEVFVPMVNNTEKYFHIHDDDRWNLHSMSSWFVKL